MIICETAAAAVTELCIIYYMIYNICNQIRREARVLHRVIIKPSKRRRVVDAAVTVIRRSSHARVS